MLTYQPERFYAAYSQLVVRVAGQIIFLAARMTDVESFTSTSNILDLGSSN